MQRAMSFFGKRQQARLLSYHSGLRSRPSFSLKITSDHLSCFLLGTSADSTSPAQLAIRRSKLAHGAVDGAVRHPAIDRLVVVVAVEDEAFRRLAMTSRTSAVLIWKC